MDIIEILYNNKINGISPLKVIEYIDNNKIISNQQSKLLILKEDNGKLINIRCVGEIYCEKGTNKKIKITSSNNPCFKITDTFNIFSPRSYDCATCHKHMATELLEGKIDILKKNG